MPAFITLSSGLYRKRIFHLEVTIFLCDFFFRVSPFSALFFAVAFSLSISFHFIFPCCFQFEFLRCRLIEFYCMRLVTLSFEGYSFSMSFDSRVPLFSMRYFRLCAADVFFRCCHNWFPIYPRRFFRHLFRNGKLDGDENNCKRQSNILTSWWITPKGQKKSEMGEKGEEARESRERKKGNIVDFIICHG